MNKKEDRKSRIALTLLFAGLTFGILLLFLALVAVIVVVFVKTDLVSVVSSVDVNKALIIFLFVLFCLVTGAGISFLLSRILTGPINKTINTINRLAEGDYKARLEIGKPLSSHPTIIEITDSFNQMAAQLDKTEILRTDFVNNFSHEFKTPIVSIMGFAKLLKRGNLTPEEQREYINVIEEESGRLSNMAAGILQLSKIENRSVLGKKRRYNLSEQIRNCVLLLEKKWTEKELDLVTQQSQLQLNAYRALNEKYNASRHVIHDVKKHLASLDGLINANMADEAEHYKELLTTELNKLMPRFECDNAILTVVINNKMDAADKQKIVFTVDAEYTEMDFISNLDITAIFSNLLDNAFEACSELPEDKRSVSLSIKRHNHFVFILMENSFKSVMTDGEAHFRSTKMGHQGIGMSNIKSACEKYSGSFNAHTENELFITEILIPIPDDQL